MATTTVSVSPSRPRRRTLRTVVLILFVFLLLMVISILLAGYLITKAALPQIDGQIQISELTAAITITRDTHGVPTIEASNFNDLYFAQGYVTAQDRLWQMDGMRRFGAGELSQVLGKDFLDHDREQRILGMRVAARKSVEVISPEDRARFAAYASGVNAFIAGHRDKLPIEFRILKYTPQPWTPEDSMVIAAQMVKDLNHYPYSDALDREKILAKVGPELTADLYVNTSWRDRPPTAVRPDH